jgi:hypothetical protein
MEATVEAAAARAGVGYRTLKRWLVEAEFQAEYRRVRRQLVETSLGRLQQGTTFAVGCLLRNLLAEKGSDQLKAAAIILSHAIRGVELADLAAEIEDVKARLKELEQHAHADSLEEGLEPSENGTPAPGRGHAGGAVGPGEA